MTNHDQCKQGRLYQGVTSKRQAPEAAAVTWRGLRLPPSGLIERTGQDAVPGAGDRTGVQALLAEPLAGQPGKQDGLDIVRVQAVTGGGFQPQRLNQTSQSIHQVAVVNPAAARQHTGRPATGVPVDCIGQAGCSQFGQRRLDIGGSGPGPGRQMSVEPGRAEVLDPGALGRIAVQVSVPAQQRQPGVIDPPPVAQRPSRSKPVSE